MTEKNKSGLFANIKGDMFGGLTSGIVALPLALAFGLSSGLGPDAGLYGAIFIAFFAALFGGTNTQISGPTAPMTAVSMLIVAGIVQSNNGDVQQALPAILTVFLLAGIILVGLGLLGLGRYIKYMPYPVVSGFMTAIGVIILITQLLPFMGYYPKEDTLLVNQFKPEAKEVLYKQYMAEKTEGGIPTIEELQYCVNKMANLSETDLAVEAAS